MVLAKMVTRKGRMFERTTGRSTTGRGKGEFTSRAALIPGTPDRREKGKHTSSLLLFVVKDPGALSFCCRQEGEKTTAPKPSANKGEGERRKKPSCEKCQETNKEQKKRDDRIPAAQERGELIAKKKSRKEEWTYIYFIGGQRKRKF